MELKQKHGWGGFYNNGLSPTSGEDNGRSLSTGGLKNSSLHWFFLWLPCPDYGCPLDLHWMVDPILRGAHNSIYLNVHGKIFVKVHGSCHSSEKTILFNFSLDRNIKRIVLFSARYTLYLQFDHSPAKEGVWSFCEETEVRVLQFLAINGIGQARDWNWLYLYPHLTPFLMSHYGCLDSSGFYGSQDKDPLELQPFM